MDCNFKLVDKFLDAIFPLPEDWGLLRDAECNEEDEVNRSVELGMAIRDVDPDAYFNYGASKFVIISPNLGNIVIKIPFHGVINVSYDEDGYLDGYDFEEFEYAVAEDHSDYCLAEYEKYKKLQIFDLDCFVAATHLYKTIEGTRIFLQEVVTPADEMAKYPKSSDRSKKIAQSWFDSDKTFYFETAWIANCIDNYGEGRVERFLDYCRNTDRDICSDMHGGNYGYRPDGSPCILDYSDFNY